MHKGDPRIVYLLDVLNEMYPSRWWIDWSAIGRWSLDSPASYSPAVCFRCPDAQYHWFVFCANNSIKLKLYGGEKEQVHWTPLDFGDDGQVRKVIKRLMTKFKRKYE